jgi:hypothetical protein
MLHHGAGGVVAAAQIGDPSALLDLSGPAYAVLSFLAILAAGGGLLVRRESGVDLAVDRAIRGLPLAAVYGIIPFAAVVFVGGYVVSQSARVGVANRLLVQTLGVLVIGAAVVLAGLGYLVVGASLTELEGDRRLWIGAAVGATLSALPWLLFPLVPAAVVWIGVAAVGLGGTTQRWVHGERTVETEARG